MGSDGATVTASLPEGIAPADLSAEQVERLVRQKTEGPDVLGTHPETGKPVLLLSGRFGPYVQLGAAEDGAAEKPKRASLPTGTSPADASLELALRLLSLPRTLGTHPESGKPVQANVGRFGHFVVHDGDFRSLGKEDDVYTVELPRALALLAQPKAGRGKRAGVEPLRTVGAHPKDGEPVLLFEGRYGPYVKHGAVNASLPKETSPDDLTLDAAVALLAERAASAPRRTARRGAASAKKGAAGMKAAPAKGAAGKKSAGAKAASGKPAAKKAAGKKAGAKKK
jgi:DNA topoisomerase I